MRKQANNFSRRKISGMTIGFMQRRRLLAGIATVAMGASLVFTTNASVHSIDLEDENRVIYADQLSIVN